jgi:hypothetical protein
MAIQHVAILGLGPSLNAYVDLVKRLGARRRFADEVWAINALGDVVQCDRIFHMDDVAVQEARAAAKPESNIAAMVEWMRSHPGPIYTSTVRDGYPGLVAFPLQDVINALGYAYFNNTAAYDGVGTDADRSVEFGSGVHDGAGMDEAHRLSLLYFLIFRSRCAWCTSAPPRR